MPKFLVTGAAGFIGSHLCDALVAAGHSVIGLDNLINGNMTNLSQANRHPNFQFIQGDIRDFNLCSQVVESVDAVFHQAALGSVPKSMTDPRGYHDVNVTGTISILEAARNRKCRVILASSSSVYGDTPTLPKHESMPHCPLSPYALTKSAVEQWAKMYYTAYQVPTVILRYFNVFGPRQNPNSEYAAVIPKWIVAGVADRPIVIHGDGKQTRDFTYVDNVVLANIAALSMTQNFGEPINIGCGSGTSLLELSAAIGEILGHPIRPTFTEPRAGDVRDSLADIQRAKAWLNIPEPIGLVAGLKPTIAAWT